MDRRLVNGVAAKLGREKRTASVFKNKTSAPKWPRSLRLSRVIASANNLQKNPFRRNSLRDEFGAKAVEMEGSGVADAAYQLAGTYFIVRGIQDYCNQDKNDDWRRCAALAAAAYTRAFARGTPPRFVGTTVLCRSRRQRCPRPRTKAHPRGPR